MPITTDRELASMLNFGVPDHLLPVPPGLVLQQEDYSHFLGLFSSIEPLEPVSTAVGVIAEPLTKFKTIVERSRTWQQWAGVDYSDRILFHANRTMLEFDGSQMFINDHLKMPFIILWMQSLVMYPLRCLRTYDLIFFIQDQARFRNSHNASADYYASQVGKVIADIDQDIRLSPQETLFSPKINMVSSPNRVQITTSKNIDADVWSATFHLEAGPDSF